MNRQNHDCLDKLVVIALGLCVSGQSVSVGLPLQLALHSVHAESSRADLGPR